jgi:hypothetical protein
MEEMTEKDWVETFHLTCLIVGEFAVSVSHSVDYTPETLQEAEQAVAEAREGQAHAENGLAIVDALLAGKVTARSDKAFGMLATMLDITEWHFAYMSRHITPTEDLMTKYLVAKGMIQATAAA